jgi:hypothetical protein
MTEIGFTQECVRWQVGVLGCQILRDCSYILSYCRRYMERLKGRKVQNNDGFILPETIILLECQ